MNKSMKCVFVLLILALFASEKVQAQEQQTSTNWNKHEIHAAVGDPGVVYLVAKMNWGLKADPILYGYGKWFGEDIYNGCTKTTAMWSVGYLYRLKKWLWLGADVAYLGAFQNVYDAPTGQQVRQNTSSYTQFLYTMRFSYLNRKHVHLYSGFSAGIMLYGYNQKFSVMPAMQFTPIGVMAGGERVKVFAELGLPMRSIFTTGISISLGNK